MAESAELTIERAAARVGAYRWVIVGLLFLATVINYIDRQMLGVLKPTLSADLGWSEIDFANIIFWFQAAYAIGYIGFGRLVDLIGAKLGYAIAFVIWTIAHIAHGGVHSVVQFSAVRFGLGIGEAGNFPAGIKAVTEWFPAKERAFAIGLFNAGANIGAIITPLVVPLLTVAYGWRAAFVITGVVTFVWLFVVARHVSTAGRAQKGQPGRACLDPAGPGRSGRRRCRGGRSPPSGKPGPMRSASSASIRSGGSSCSGCPAISPSATTSISSSSARLWSPSICCPTSARLPAAGLRRA